MKFLKREKKYSIEIKELDEYSTRIFHFSGGGGAHNPTIVEIFEIELGEPVYVPTFPQLFVALAAALYTLEEDSSV